MARTDITPAAPRVDAALALLRLVVGVVFIAHGGQKLFVYGIDGVAGAFAQMGIPGAAVAGPLTAFVELFGGMALLSGLLTRLAGAGLSVVMLGAIFFAHLSAGFFAPQGYEFPLTLLAATAALSITGAGRWSLDAVLARHRDAARPAAAAAATVRRAA